MIAIIIYLRRFYYRNLCKIGVHNYMMLPLPGSNGQKVYYDVSCGRCGKMSPDATAQLLAKIHNSLKVKD